MAYPIKQVLDENDDRINQMSLHIYIYINEGNAAANFVKTLRYWYHSEHGKSIFTLERCTVILPE